MLAEFFELPCHVLINKNKANFFEKRNSVNAHELQCIFEYPTAAEKFLNQSL